MQQLTFKRARTAENKRQRAAALLDAARALALEAGVGRVTWTAVAQRAGVHHSAMRRYFDSPEAILVRLAGEGWQHWSDTVCSRLGGSSPVPVVQVASTLADALADDALLCDLLAYLPLHYDSEVRIELSCAAMHPAMQMADVIAAVTPSLGRHGAADAVAGTAALAGSFWHGAGDADFRATLTRLATAMCVGLADGGRGAERV